MLKGQIRICSTKHIIKVNVSFFSRSKYDILCAVGSAELMYVPQEGPCLVCNAALPPSYHIPPPSLVPLGLGLYSYLSANENQSHPAPYKPTNTHLPLISDQ